MPLVSWEASPFLDAWRELDSDRNWLVGFGGAVPRQIGLGALDTFARRHGIEGDVYDDFVAAMRTADGLWMAEMNRQRPKTPPPRKR